MIEKLFALLVFVGFLGVVGCFVAPFLSPKAWTLHNRTTLGRFADRWLP